MKKILSQIFVVTTNREVWAVVLKQNYGTQSGVAHQVVIQKIAISGNSTKNGYRLKIGTFVAFQPSGLARFHMPKAALGTCVLQIPDDDNSRQWGCGAPGGIAAIFRKRHEALVCSLNKNLGNNDIRWETETEIVVKEIGLDHPFFCISTDFTNSFHNCHDLGHTPNERRLIDPIKKEDVTPDDELEGSSGEITTKPKRGSYRKKRGFIQGESALKRAGLHSPEQVQRLVRELLSH